MLAAPIDPRRVRLLIAAIDSLEREDVPARHCVICHRTCDGAGGRGAHLFIHLVIRHGMVKEWKDDTSTPAQLVLDQLAGRASC